MYLSNQKSYQRALNCRLGYLNQKITIGHIRVRQGEWWLKSYLEYLQEVQEATLKELRELQN